MYLSYLTKQKHWKEAIKEKWLDKKRDTNNINNDKEETKETSIAY